MGPGRSRPQSWERRCTIVSEPAKSNRPPASDRARPLIGAGRLASPWAVWFEAGLGAVALLIAPILVLVPHGAAPLGAFAGLCAAGLIAAAPAPWALEGLRWPAALLTTLVVWAALSALWEIEPARAMALDLRLAALFVAALALAGAVDRLAAPDRLVRLLFAGTAIALALAAGDVLTAGGLSRYVTVRGFRAVRLNQFSVWLAMLWLPFGALLVCRGRRLAAFVVAAIMAGVVWHLEGTTGKAALALSLPVAALFWYRRRAMARIAAALSAVAILTAPLTLPRLEHLPRLLAAADSIKDSAGHRLYIWAFAGDRIAEKPLAGWGLDSSRAIPGGDEEIRPAQKWLPLHPHDAALQVWLELGAPGAVVFALFVGLLWLRLADAPWPRLYTAAAAGSLAAAQIVAFAGWGIWQEWWLGTLALAAFFVLTMARVATPAPSEATPRLRRRGWRGGGR